MIIARPAACGLHQHFCFDCSHYSILLMNFAKRLPLKSIALFLGRGPCFSIKAEAVRKVHPA
ncbi:MAG: hypothetical protein D3921_13335 [Candidatus Electrothrix sp. AW1]|nr:hypothetical protein [Candidatus Electrothrix sp. AX1]MCI5183474.1 hypothetical protein [Candidatus Electrothrix gigas]